MGRPKTLDVQAKVELREIMETISTYLNQLEEIFATYSLEDTKAEKIVQVANVVGKLSILHTEACRITGAYDE